MIIQLVLTAVLTISAAAVEVKMLDGAVRSGTLMALNLEQLALVEKEQPAMIALADVATVTSKAAPPAARGASINIVLADGSTLTASSYEVRGGEAQVTLSGGQRLTLANRLVASVRFHDDVAAPEAQEGQWKQIAATKTASDLLIVRKKNALDYYEGVVGAVSRERVEFKHDDESLSVKRAKIEGIVYYRATAEEFAAPICQVTAGGSHVPARQIGVASGNLYVTTPAGLKLNWPLESLSALDFSGGKIQYLSDLEPESITYAPYFEGDKPVGSLAKYYGMKRDRSFEHPGLQLDKKKYAKGLCLTSRTMVTYRLGGKYRQFKSMIGIEDAVRTAGNVHVSIIGDSQVLWESEIRGSDAAREIQVDLTGVGRLEIQVDYGKDLDVADHLALADARMIK